MPDAAPLRLVRALAPALALALAMGTAFLAPWPVQAEDGLLAPLDGADGTPAAPWRLALLPKQVLPVTQYRVADVDARRVLRVQAEASYGNLVHALPEGTAASRALSWRWRVDRPQERADLRTRGGDDAALKVCAMFDMDLRAVPFVERQLLRLARARSQEPLPAATLCYVWDARQPAGAVLDNAYTRRVRMIVLRGEGAATGEWSVERRDLAADFRQLFGAESPRVPPLTAIVVSADGDNTGGRSLAFLSDLILE